MLRANLQTIYIKEKLILFERLKHGQIQEVKYKDEARIGQTYVFDRSRYNRLLVYIQKLLKNTFNLNLDNILKVKDF